MKFCVILLTALSAVCADITDHGATEADVQENREVSEDEIGMDGRIVNGEVAARAQFPWQVMIRYRTKGWFPQNMICGGSLISPKHILTAAHCLYQTQISQVILGTIEPYDVSNSERLSPTIAKASYNAGYIDANLSNDIGIIELAEPVTYTDTIQAIKLSKDYTLENVNVTVSGFGQIRDTPRLTADRLYFVELTTINNEVCSDTYGSYVRNYTLCTIGTRGRNSCSGDSGGPLIQYDENGVASQVGIVSFVASSGCEKPLPAGYIRVSSSIPWIEKVTGLTF